MRLIGWILGLVMLLGGAAEAAAKPAITDARLGVEPGLTRVVISLTQRSDFKVFTLADPYRVVIDMSEVDWKVPSGNKLQGQGLVAGMRYGLFKAGTSRVVLDLMEPSEVARAEFAPARQWRAAAAAGRPAAGARYPVPRPAQEQHGRL